MKKEYAFQSEIELTIDWSDLDLFGHVNNVAIFRFIQSSRIRFWEECSFNKLYDEIKIGPILASCKCDFLKELNYPNTIRIETNLAHVGKTSFKLEHELKTQDELIVRGEDVIVCFDFDQKEKVEIPESLKKAWQS